MTTSLPFIPDAILPDPDFFEMITNQYMEVKDDYSNLLLAQAQDDEMFLLNSKLKKEECFYACHNMSQHGIWQGKLSRFFAQFFFEEKTVNW